VKHDFKRYETTVSSNHVPLGAGRTNNWKSLCKSLHTIVVITTALTTKNAAGLG
jgi:hypothetical protein